MNSLLNPYRPRTSAADTSSDAPFAGRRETFARLHQYLKDNSNAGAMIFTGWSMVGKTTFLQQFDRVFDDSLIGVYIPLREVTSETQFLQMLIDATMHKLSTRDFTLTRIPEAPGQFDDGWRWLADQWLPAVKAALRQHRTLVWLLDDVNYIQERAIFRGLEQLLATHPRLKLVFTLDTEFENHLQHMGVLVKPSQTLRLTSLSLTETSTLLREPVSDWYTLDDEAIEEAFRLTGGQPQWVQRLGFHLFRQQDVKALVPTIYAQSDAEISAIWHKLTDNERLILSAIGGLLHTDPLQGIDVAAIAGWLVKTDYPLDETAVHATIRSLEYRELVMFAGRNLTDIRVTSGLIERRLVEDAGKVRPMAYSQTALSLNRRVLIVVCFVIVMLMLAAVGLGGTTPATTNPPIPTVTLVSQP